MNWLTAVVEGLFLVLFLATLWRYIQQRDPVSRDLALVFSPLAAALVGEIWKGLVGSTSPILGAIAGGLFLLQPVFALHLVSLLRPVPRRLIWASAIILVAGTALAIVLPGSTAQLGPKTVAWIVVLGGFVAFEAAAAIYLLLEAVSRRGPVAVRMGLAGISTGVFAFALVVAIVGRVISAPTDVSSATAAILALLSGFGYVLALLPPGPIRRIAQARTTVDYTRELIARSGDPIGSIWAGFTDVAVRMQGGAAAMLTGSRTGMVSLVATTGMVAPENLESMPWSQFDDRLASGPSRWDVPVADVGPIRRSLAEAAGAKYVSIVPVELPDSGQRAALVLMSTHRALFHPSDAELLAALGAQTAIVAERRAVMAEQEALADRLATTVEALRSASAAKSDFVASMSHEFRTPLSAIIGFSDLMTTESRNGDRVSVPTEWVDHIQRGGQHLLTLVNDVLDLARVEAGRLELRPEPVDIGLAVTEAVNGLRPLADRKNLEFRAEARSFSVSVDRGRFRQMLYNLISNAIKYTPEGGSIRVTAALVGGEVRIAVADTGVGIASEDHPRVFEEFRQVGDPSERQPGSGLGLAVTKRLAEAHDGRIELVSARGQGSTFTLVLPAGDAEGAATPKPSLPGLETADGAAVASGDILVIEDDPSAVRLLREYLEGAGYQVRVASTGETGIMAARTSRPAAIVLDVLLPGVDGWEVLRRLKADAQLHDVPVVIVTVIEEREVGLALGAVDYLVKPIHREALLGCLARFVAADDTRGVAKRVLVIDDEPGALAYIRGALEPEGVVVVTAQGGREALDWAQHGQLVDLVVCDLVMPDVDGFEVIAALKHNLRTADLPIVVCTAHDLTAEQKSRLNGKILGIVTKGQDARVGLLDWLDLAVPMASR